MEEGSLYVETHYLKVVLVCVGQENLYSAKFNHRCVCFTIIFWSLAKTLSYKSCLFFTSYDGTVWIVFVIESPMDADSFTAG